LLLRHRLRSTLFPYTTLFRSDREMARLAIGPVNYERLADKCNLRGSEDLFAALGAGDVRLAHAVGLAQQLLDPHERSVQQLDLIDRKSTRLNSSHVKISYAVF